MKYNFKSIQELSVLQNFLEQALYNLTKDTEDKPSQLLASVFKDLYANKVFPKIYLKNKDKFKITFSLTETIALNILLERYDLTDLDNHFSLMVMQSFANKIDHYLVNNLKSNKPCVIPQISSTTESNFFIES